MKRYINTLAVLITSVLILSASSFAQPASAHLSNNVLKLSLKAFPSNLESNVPGVVESTIYDAVLLKYYFPKADYSEIIDRLNDIAKKNNDASIRYKAQLASTYLSDTSNIQIVPNASTLEHDYLFRQIAEQLTNKLLVARQ